MAQQQPNSTRITATVTPPQQSFDVLIDVAATVAGVTQTPAAQPQAVAPAGAPAARGGIAGPSRGLLAWIATVLVAILLAALIVGGIWRFFSQTPAPQPLASPPPQHQQQQQAPAPAPAPAVTPPQAGGQQVPDPRSPFVAAAPSGWHFTGATKGRDGANCEARGGKIVPDTSKARIPTATGFDYPNKCTADR